MFEDVRDTPARPEPHADGSTPDGAAEGALPEATSDSGGASPGFEAGATASAVGADTGAPAGTVDYKDRWLRAEAEFQNARRRAQRERDESVQRAEDRLLLDVIELLDDLERALASLSGEQAAQSWAQGVALTAQRMRDTLARWGVTPTGSEGQPFDPNVHDALLEVPPPEGVAPGTVVHESLKGYRRGGRALRAARVVVAKFGSED